MSQADLAASESLRMLSTLIVDLLLQITYYFRHHLPLPLINLPPPQPLHPSRRTMPLLRRWRPQLSRLRRRRPVPELPRWRLLQGHQPPLVLAMCARQRPYAHTHDVAQAFAHAKTRPYAGVVSEPKHPSPSLSPCHRP